MKTENDSLNVRNLLSDNGGESGQCKDAVVARDVDANVKCIG